MRAKRSGLTWLSVQQISKLRLVNGSVWRNHLFFLATCLTTAYCVSALLQKYHSHLSPPYSFCRPSAPCRQGCGCCPGRCRRRSLLACPCKKLADNLNNIYCKQITLKLISEHISSLIHHQKEPIVMALSTKANNCKQTYSMIDSPSYEWQVVRAGPMIECE